MKSVQMPSHAVLTAMVFFTLCFGSLAQQATDNKKILLKVNLGGGPVSDFLGEDQVLDMSDFSKNVAKVKIQNTDQPEIFQTTRFARANDMTFRIPVPTGIYSLTLLFAEGFRPACAPGGRVFDIHIGTPVSGVTKIVDGFDLFQNAGCHSAHGKRFNQVPSKDGIVVHLVRRTQHPALAGFIVEGFPMPVGDGSEFKAVGRTSGGTGASAISTEPAPAGQSSMHDSSGTPDSPGMPGSPGVGGLGVGGHPGMGGPPPMGGSMGMPGSYGMGGVPGMSGTGEDSDSSSQNAMPGAYGAPPGPAPGSSMMRLSRRLASIDGPADADSSSKRNSNHSIVHKSKHGSKALKHSSTKKSSHAKRNVTSSSHK